MYLPSIIYLLLNSIIFIISGAPISTHNSLSQEVSTTASPSSTSTSSTSVIKITKLNPFYWIATFSSEGFHSSNSSSTESLPINLQNNAFFTSFYALCDEILSSSPLKVVVFTSSSEYFFSTHVDLVNPLSGHLWPGSPKYWDCISRLANSNVLTVAAIRGIAYNAGAEIAAVMDVRFASREKGVLAQLEVGFGGNPGGGGIEMLSRLTGRSRALEVVLGSDRIDADTAALYGWINRAIPDSEFDFFVDNFARRVAGWDHFAIAAAKKLINERTGFPTAVQQQGSFNSFLADVAQGAVPARLKAMSDAGLQRDLDFEINLHQEELRFVGDGPWNV
ncbi:hypothetical protein SS1G_05609 [Sclerotinia sclerotiorum 1980 UF-70]|uniref:Enoyl-CoA hydratase n=2 Tax=Sclerotinia sclerotiorum (strain ATCC 18683 / 1980 / Ss-1) TaxID=665079 RepID=A7EJW4_SCLS1|nr:hypothetical protein SS1G_05609 [Sclerotinia sclerotiorum 1980 UF-70]APA12030.1 hypothetical protein sscle_08g068000 [Sclerotinia sclerotiorum 1980 UF-70]EDO03130.1 hypothetical protein SS1G_05609 [Sclerotinia sclerotiorum 1980 UF-70]